MKRTQKGFVNLIILIAIVIGALGYFAYKNGQIKIDQPQDDKPTLNITQVPTENWSVYEDPKYNYFIKYPSDWIYNFNQGYEQPVSFTSPETIGPPKYHLIITPVNNPRNEYDETTFKTFGSSCVGNCPEEGGAKKVEGVDYHYVAPEVEIKIINNAKVYYIKSSKEGSQRGKVRAIIPIPNKQIFLTVDPNFWPKDEGYHLFDQILSTFKFINVE